MSSYQQQADQLTQSLGLSRAPVACAFVDEAPADVAAFDGAVPAGCSFWQEATERTFSTVAADHGMCSIGIHTHNLQDAPASQPGELKAALEAMIGLDYVREDEIAGIPVMERSARRVVYGPLAEFPVAPDAVLLFAHAQQGLVLTEAVARVDAGIPPAMGRPACAVLPQVINQDRAAMSLGCCGARAYLDGLSDAVAMWALPGSKLDAYCEQVAGLAKANTILTAFHQHRRDDVVAGGRPTVADSLKALS